MDNAKELEQIRQKINAQQLEKIALGWRGGLDKRERRLIANCCVYASNDPAGLPGHQLMLIIAQLASMLDECA